MNSFEKQLDALVKLFRKTKIEYVVLGGIAVGIYGEVRLTLDIDVNAAIEKDKLDEFLKQAKQKGFLPIVPDIKAFIYKTGVIPMRFTGSAVGSRCDIIIAENLIEYLALKRGRVKRIGAVKVRLISPCLLYTSPSPRDVEESRMPSSA